MGEARRSDGAPAAERVAGLVAASAGLAGLDAVDRAVVAFTIRLTLHPGAVSREDHAPLREVGLGDLEIHDIVHVVACFSYMNRLADGTGVGLLESQRAFAVELLGPAEWDAHQAWAAPGGG